MEMWQARSIQNYIVLNFYSKIRAEDLAEVAQLSRSSFHRAFKASFGYTPSQYVIRMRIARAQRLMTMSRDPLRTIAAECGFVNQSDFKCHFRNVVGQRPVDWRARQPSSHSRTFV
jgi:AraC family transcriptional regulator